MSDHAASGFQTLSLSNSVLVNSGMDTSGDEFFSPSEGEGVTDMLEDPENDSGEGDTTIILSRLTPVSCYQSSGKYGSDRASDMAQKEATKFKGSRVALTFPRPMNPQFYLPKSSSQMQVIPSTDLSPAAPCIVGNETTRLRNCLPLPPCQSELGGCTEIPQRSQPHYSTQSPRTTSQFDLTPLTRRDLLILQDEIKTNVASQIVDRVFEKVNDAWQLHNHPTVARGAGHRSEEDDDGWMGDVEESSPTPRIRREIKHQPRAVNDFHKKIRNHGLLLMSRTDKDSPFKNMPTPDAIAAFNPRTGPCCTVDRFSVDLQGTSRSPWNKSAADIFATNFRETYSENKVSHDSVVRAWTKHFETLKGQYIALGQVGQGKKKNQLPKQIANRRRQRRVELYGRRLKAAQSLPGDVQDEFKYQSIKLVQWLGPNGMSSDESDHEGLEGKPSYFILQKVWRSIDVTNLLRLLDALHLYKKFGKAWNASSGAWPHMRSSRMRVSASSPVENLPQNLYSQHWLKENKGFLHTMAVPLLPIPQQIKDMAAPYDLNEHSIEMKRKKEKESYFPCLAAEPVTL